MKLNIFHGVILILVAGAGLFFLKHTVEEKERHLANLKQEYLEDQKALRVLKAEWAYLNSPQYLQELTRKYLALGPVSPKQVVAWTERLPRKPGITPVNVALSGTLPAQRPVSREEAALRPGRSDEP